MCGVAWFSIPVYSIIIRYNLIESGLCGKHWANVWAVLFPWVFSVPFYTGTLPSPPWCNKREEEP
jgi:hypothetical protein